MPATLLTILIILTLLNLALCGFMLWLLCRLFGVRRPASQPGTAPTAIRYRRALAVTLGFGLCTNALSYLVYLGADRIGFGKSFTELLTFLAVGVALQLLLLAVFLRVFLSTNAMQTIAVGTCWALFLVADAVGLVALVWFTTAAAFTMPSGSMADTLWGYHKPVICPQCGHSFAVNASSEADPSDGSPAYVIACTCPNCRQMIHFDDASPGYRIDNPTSVEVPDPGVSGGDHILVAKGFLGPQTFPPARLDLIVFHLQSPRFPDRPSMTYVKRLVGLPGETVAIHGGKLYLLGSDGGLTYQDRPDPQAPSGWERAQPAFMHPDDPPAHERFHAGKFRLLHKPPDKVLDLMRLVYDNDHPARDLTGPKWRRWASGTGTAWKQADTTFAHDGSGGEQWLRYRHVLRDNDGKPSLIGDATGYNSWFSHRMHHFGPFIDKNWVGDLILECAVTVDRAEGELLLELSRGADRFQAKWELASGTCTLWRLTEGKKPEQLASKPTTLKGKGTYRVRLANVDEKLTLWVDDRLPFGEEGVVYPPAAVHGPRKENDLDRPASIGVKGAAVRVSKLKLFRDTYYTTGHNGGPANPDVPGVDLADPATWDGLKEPPLATCFVQPGHYFGLGDNSQESSDSRFWGLVPQQHLLGKAVLVYYPRGRWRLLR